MWWHSRDDRIRWRLNGVGVTAVAGFRDRAVGKVVGTVRCPDPVIAPVSHRPCAWFEVCYMQLEDGVWVEYNRWIAGNRFYVADQTGEALVEVDHCDGSLLPDHDVREPSHDPRHRRLEGIVADGERVAVLGYGSWEPDPDPASGGHGYRDRPVKLVLRGGGKQRLLITDKPTIVDR